MTPNRVAEISTLQKQGLVQTETRQKSDFFISNFRLVLNVACFLLDNSAASEFYMPTFRNTLFHLHRQVGMKNTYLPVKMGRTVCSEASAYNI